LGREAGLNRYGLAPTVFMIVSMWKGPVIGCLGVPKHTRLLIASDANGFLSAGGAVTATSHTFFEG
jgi:hypothetical protein